MRGLMRSGRLWRHDDVDATRRLLDHLLLEGQAYFRIAVPTQMNSLGKLGRPAPLLRDVGTQVVPCVAQEK